MKIKVKCPSCGKVLILDDKPNIDKMSFTCPACKGKYLVGNCQRIVEKPQVTTGEETQYAGQAAKPATGEETQIVGYNNTSSGEETQIVGYNNKVSVVAKAGTLVDSFGKSYQLSIGINTIGRKANSSTATVQIDTTDRTMSRSHAVIEVRNAGGQIIHILKNGANKNPSYHKGILIGPADQMVLNNGDRVKFGTTELTFKNN